VSGERGVLEGGGEGATGGTWGGGGYSRNSQLTKRGFEKEDLGRGGGFLRAGRSCERVRERSVIELIGAENRFQKEAMSNGGVR